MATNFSPCKGSYVLNQFPSNVMFGMNGFHVSASRAIQGHHGPLVFFTIGQNLKPVENECFCSRQNLPKNKILGLSKLKQIADDILKYIQNGK